MDDIDFVVQDLESEDIEILMDRTAISAGGRLWQQIGEAISNPTKRNTPSLPHIMMVHE